VAGLIIVNNHVLNVYVVLFGVLQFHPRNILAIWLSSIVLNPNSNTESHGSLKICQKQQPGVGHSHVKL